MGVGSCLPLISLFNHTVFVLWWGVIAPSQRWRTEAFWIRKLGMVLPQGLNIKGSKYLGLGWFNAYSLINITEYHRHINTEVGRGTGGCHEENPWHFDFFDLTVWIKTFDLVVVRSTYKALKLCENVKSMGVCTALPTGFTERFWKLRETFFITH